MIYFNKITGKVLIELKSAYIERFINICTKENVQILSVHYVELGVAHLSINFIDYPKIKNIAKDSKYQCKIIKKEGLSFKLFKKRKRFGLMIGLFCIAIVYIEASSRLVGIEINGTSNEVEIYNILASKNIEIGMKVEEIATRTLPSEMILENENILWCALNVKGNTLTVEVAMREPTPEIYDRFEVADIIAEKSGVIDSINVKFGEALVNVGESFDIGDPLVSANALQFPQIEDYKELFVQSLADIYARFSYEFERILPQNFYEKNYTGREKTCISLIFQKKSYNLFKNSGNLYTFYDKIVEVKTFNLSKYIEFPFSLQIEKYKEYEKTPINLQENYEILNENAKKYVVSNNNCAILNENFAKTSNSEFVRILYKCETLERVGTLIKR